MASVDLRYSKDGGANWSNWRTLDMGDLGDFVKRVQARRLGRGRQFVFDVRITDNARADILGAALQTEGNDS